MTKVYKNIIVAIDGSKEADRGFKKAIDIAKRYDSQLYLVHIIDLRSYATLQAYDQGISARAEKYAQEMLEGYKLDALEVGIKEPKVVIDFGSPKIKIAKDIAVKYNADLIICGATGLNAVERLIIGSVSEHIVRHAKCDCLVVRSDTE